MQNILRDIRKTDMLWYLLCAPLAILASTLFAMSLQPVIDAGLAGDMAVFAAASSRAAALVAADVLAAYLEDVQRLKIKTACTRQLRYQYFSGFFQQRIQQFIETDSAAHLSKLTVDAEVISEKYCESLLHIYRYIWSLLISVAAIISARWELAIYVVVFSLISVNLPKLFQRKADAAEQDYLSAGKAHLDTAQESIRNYLLTRLHGLVSSQIKKYQRAAGNVERKDRSRRRKTFAINATAGGVSELSFVLMIILAMLLVMDGKLSVGYVMSVSQLLGGIMFPFEMLPGCILSYRTGRKLFETNRTQMEAAAAGEERTALPLSRDIRRIQAAGLSFAYQGAAPILNDVSLSLEGSKKYALVGASGSGKSTLSKIIMGFLSPDGGEVTINGLPVEQINQEDLYSAVSYQSQSVTFFTDTIRNNILLGRSLPEGIWKAILRSARLEAMLDGLPEREDSLIEENGKNISGGEAQRIGLARCLAKRPRFMIFDEIAASLDNQNALEIEKMILSLPDVGVLMITHRIYEENMREYDTIFVLRDGKISEQGTWDELIGKRGDLYQLAMRSAGKADQHHFQDLVQ